MLVNSMRAFALSTAVAILSSAAAPAVAASSPYAGAWSMVLVTTSGHCGVIKIGMAVNRGNISATSGKYAQDCLGRAHLGSGATKINGVAGPRQAIGTGKFNRTKGGGKWNGTGPPASARAIGSPTAPGGSSALRLGRLPDQGFGGFRRGDPGAELGAQPVVPASELDQLVRQPKLRPQMLEAGFALGLKLPYQSLKSGILGADLLLESLGAGLQVAGDVVHAIPPFPAF
ncbi:MAG TPA: hypothetical protein VFR71_05990 [Methyloceanibacter sp.]|nr:hypothetical protein [Methyloceanibacter sp.]